MMTAAYTLLACVVIGLSLCSLNRMNHRTRMTVRAAYVAIPVGVAANWMLIMSGHGVNFSDTLLLLGLTLKMMGDKRQAPRTSWHPLDGNTQLGK